MRSETLKKGAVLALAPLLGACAPDMGVWMFRIDMDVEEDLCEQVVEHNIIGGFEEVDDESSDWVEDETRDASEMIAFVEISEGAGDSCLLVWGEYAFPGTCSGSAWTFEWEKSLDSSESKTHVLGYAFSHESKADAVTTITLNIDGDYGTGMMVTDSSTSNSYVESDMWAEGVGLQGGQTPFSAFVSVQKMDEGGNPVTTGAVNTRAMAECSQSDGTLNVTETCQGGEYKIVANRYMHL